MVFAVVLCSLPFFRGTKDTRGAIAPLSCTPSPPVLFAKEPKVENNYRKGFADISFGSDIAPLQRLKFLLQGHIGAKMAVGVHLIVKRL